MDNFSFILYSVSDIIKFVDNMTKKLVELQKQINEAKVVKCHQCCAAPEPRVSVTALSVIRPCMFPKSLRDGSPEVKQGKYPITLLHKPFIPLKPPNSSVNHCQVIPMPLPSQAPLVPFNFNVFPKPHGSVLPLIRLPQNSSVTCPKMTQNFSRMSQNSSFQLKIPHCSSTSSSNLSQKPITFRMTPNSFMYPLKIPHHFHITAKMSSKTLYFPKKSTKNSQNPSKPRISSPMSMLRALTPTNSLSSIQLRYRRRRPMLVGQGKVSSADLPRSRTKKKYLRVWSVQPDTTLDALSDYLAHTSPKRRQKSQVGSRISDVNKSHAGTRAAAVPPPRHHHHRPPQPAQPPQTNGGIAAPPLQKNVPAPGPRVVESSLSNKNKVKSKKLTKADIGLPQDFKHVFHVGWDIYKGFDIDNVPVEDMKDFFQRAGVSESQLRDKDTRDYIYDFIHSHGGVDAVKEALGTGEGEEEIFLPPMRPVTTPRGPMPPPVPARSPAAMPTHTAPPTLVRETTGPRLAPAPPARAPPPPPPPPQRTLPPPPQTGPGGLGGPPPPPPPPLAPAAPPVPAFPTTIATPAAPAPPAVPDMRSALMESIRNKQSLKHVEVDKLEKVTPSAGGEGKRGDLLSEIRQGIELRSVSSRQSDSNECKSIQQQGLAGALARALDHRAKAMHSDSSSDDNAGSTSEDEEWD